MNLLERQHVLVVPGSSFNIDYKTHFRMTFLPDEETLATVLGRMETLLSDQSS
jgi:alanine-synthesizing transaminase